MGASEATLKLLMLGEDRSAGKTLKGVGSEAQGLMGHLRGVGKVASGVFAGQALYDGAKAASRALFDMGKNAMEDAANARRLKVALENTTGANNKQVASVERWISKQGVALGVTDDELRPALQRLAQSSHDITEAQKLTSLAMDVSAGSGKSLATVSEALMKAQNGNVGALGRLGFATKDAAGKTKDFDEITKDMAQTFGGQAAAAADSAQGKFDRLKLVFDETKESIGYKLIPVATALATLLLTQVGPAIGDFSDWFNVHMVPALQQAGQWISQYIVPILRELGHWILNEVVPAVREFAEKALAGASEAINRVKDHIGALQPYITLLVAAWHGIWNVLSQFVLPVLGDLAKTILPMIGSAIVAIITVIGALSKAAIWLWNNAFGPVLRFLLNALGMALDLFGKMLTALGHVPGFGWAKDLGRDLKNAADDARGLADGIRDIPPHKDVKVRVNYVFQRAPGGLPIYTNDPGAPKKHSAVGSPFLSGMSWVGERGPELAEFPRGTRIYTAADSARIAAGAGTGGDMGTLTLVVKSDTGQVIEQKLIKFQRDQGGRPLAIVTAG